MNGVMVIVMIIELPCMFTTLYLIVFKDTILTYLQITSVTPGHNELPGVIFVDKYEQPSDDKCMGSIVRYYYGRLEETSIVDMVSRQQTGEMHTALYDFIGNNVYFSWAIKSPISGDIIPAYRRYNLGSEGALSSF